jgi:hypothetical protein
VNIVYLYREHFSIIEFAARARYFVARHNWKVRSAPIVVHLVHIAVANTAEENFGLDVTTSGVPPLDCHGLKWRFGCARTICRNLFGHGQAFT